MSAQDETKEEALEAQEDSIDVVREEATDVPVEEFDNVAADNNGEGQRRHNRHSHMLKSVLLRLRHEHGLSEADRHPANLPKRFETEDEGFKAKVKWFGALCVSGLGMFMEALVIVTTGQVKSVWHDEYPECWVPDQNQVCPNNIQCCELFPNTPIDESGQCAATLEPEGFCVGIEERYPDSVLCTQGQVGGISWAEFAGIMAGMLMFGWLGDHIGRVNAGKLTSILMLIGVGGMTFFDNANASTLFVMFSVFFAIYGVGTGGEYPLTASGAAEHHAMVKEEALNDDEERHRVRLLRDLARTNRRGETITITFAMQGVGAVAGSLILVCLIYFSKESRIACDVAGRNAAGVNPDALSVIWRSFYFIAFLFVVMLLLYRWLVVVEGDSHETIMARQRRRVDAGMTHNKLDIIRFYAFRILGTGGTWFVWDVAFYGLKLYSGPILDAINPSGDLIVNNGFLLVNNICGMAGYYVAAIIIDRETLGRKRLQLLGFVVSAILFAAMGAVFDTASSQLLLFILFISTFVGALSCNVTTYVMAAETYPTEIRTTTHGISAFMGKFGALTATIAFGYLNVSHIFYVCSAVSFVGIFVTLLFSVDLTRVSLAHHDAQLELLLHGRVDEYKGELNNPKHLSLFERWTGRHGEYDPSWAPNLFA